MKPILTVQKALVATVLILVPFHAILTVWASTLVGHFIALRLWDELLLAMLTVATSWFIYREPDLRRLLVRSWLVRLTALYVAMTVVWGFVALALHQVTLVALAYGLVIDLRILVWFVCVLAVAHRMPWLHRHWPRLIFVPLAVVVIFGLLQFFILPHDFLMHFGYGPKTYVPFITINQDSPVMRIQSTLRGANPLGAYLAVMAGLLTALLAWRRQRLPYWLLLGATLLALFATFSRSGWAASVIVIVVAAGMRLARYRRVVAAGLIAVCVLVLAGAVAVSQVKNAALQDALLHVNDNSTATQTSNGQHVAAVEESVRDIVYHPLGEGPGSSGQASWYNAGHPIRNTESFFLQLAEEVGWVGFGLFMAILVLIGKMLWQRRADPLAIGLFASLFGLIIVSLFTYSWADDTLAFVWWGLVAIALARPRGQLDGVAPEA